MYPIVYTYGVKQKKQARTSKEQFLSQVEVLWPAMKGSLALVHKPCIRPTCPACASGKKHPAFLLSFTQNERRRCRYVPQALVPRLTQAIDNGRRLEALLYEAGPAMLQEYRDKRTGGTPAARANTRQSVALKAKTKRKN